MTDHLFSPDYDQPVDTSTLVDRMPGTPDAACMCVMPGVCPRCEGAGCALCQECLWPFCPWPDHHNDEEAA